VADADWIAADLVAQAEHDPDARSIFVTWNRALAGRVSQLVDGGPPAADRETLARVPRRHRRDPIGG
jgi:histidinol dehydrogenase